MKSRHGKVSKISAMTRCVLFVCNINNIIARKVVCVLSCGEVSRRRGENELFVNSNDHEFPPFHNDHAFYDFS